MNKNIYNKGIFYLARREMSCGELLLKLKEKLPNEPEEDFEEVLEHLKDKNYVSDERFIEMFIRKEKAQKNGPIKIRHKLAEKKVSSHLISLQLFYEDEDFFDNCKILLGKRLKSKNITPSERQKHYRYLMGKGYSGEHIGVAFKSLGF